jgi:hypothetical protein
VLVGDEQITVEPEAPGGNDLRVHLHDLLQVVFARYGRLDEIEVLACALHQKTTGHGCSFRGVPSSLQIFRSKVLLDSADVVLRSFVIGTVLDSSGARFWRRDALVFPASDAVFEIRSCH